MGRTFGLLIVSIGLWLVFSLPTRGPATDNASSVVVAVPAPVPVTQPSAIAGVSSVAGAETRSTTLGGPATAAAILPSVILSRPDERTAAAPIVTRPKRGQDERAVAARNREFESEPEVATARPPEPVAVTAINGLSVTLESKTARIVVPSDAQSGQIRIMPTAVAPAPSAPASKATAVPQPPAQPVNGVPVNAALGGSPSRIVEAARRDLAMAVVPIPGRSTAGADQEQSRDIPAAARAATEGVQRTAQNGSNDKPVKNLAQKRKPSNGESDHAKRVVPRAPVREETRVAAAPRPQQQRVRITQAYAPPSYVGRVVVRYPGPVYVPSSASFGRSQFRGDAMWDAIKRNGM